MTASILMALAFLANPESKPELWFYYSTNLWVDKNITRLEEVWRRAAKAGYRRVLLADSKFARLGDMDRRYFGNVEKVKKLARELDIEIVPALFSIGYSNNMLWHDPNLAEGLPVRDALFVVQGGEARLVPDPPVSFREKWDWKDDAVGLENGAATVRDNRGNARLVQKLKVARFRCYHIAVQAKTEDFTGEPRVQALAEGKPLCFTNLGVKRTQDWKEHHLVFNSLDHEEVMVYFGVWGEAKGILSWRGWKIEEAGLVNVLRREGAPCLVKGYVEGKDYQKIVDARMGNVPYNGEYEIWHEPPAIKTRLPEGTRLRVSWYHPTIIYDGQVMCCLSEPRLLDLLRDEARRMKEAWGTKGFMMSHDEIRALNWDESCRRRGLEAGAMVAENARRCVDLLEGAAVHVWSDMFDPHHNARKDYYLVRGDLSGSWKGLKKEVVIVNWNFDQREKSLKFFADRGHRQVIAGYYDGRPEDIRKWLEAAAKVQGVIGLMYTTWQDRYDDLEAFARHAGRP
ncbi:MAG: hypothetical protein HY717_02915 [Planctomycetes bacterium]|nr:hypothetical protein [Planctomycetota bacterium]